MSTDQNVHRRQRDLYDPDEHRDVGVTIVGLGNIGSHSALALARMGIAKLELIDADRVEAHNLASQAYTLADVGEKKVEALAAQVKATSPDCIVTTRDEWYTGKRAPEHGVVVIAVDSMAERETIASELTQYDVYVIDGRMGGGQIEVYAQHAREWPGTLYEDPDVDPCAARFISYTSYIIAGIIANTVKRHVMGERDIARLLLHTATYESIVQRYDAE